MTRKQRKKWRKDMAEAANTLFAEGTSDPSAIEIATKYLRRKPSPRFVAQVLHDLLPIRDLLANGTYRHSLGPVNRYYYEHHREEPPTTTAEAMACLPIGRGNRTMGLRLFAGDDDLIALTQLSLGMKSGAGKYRACSDRLLKGVDEALFSHGEVRDRVLTARSQMEPSMPELMARVMGELPERTDSS